ncbi:hypothetical protein EV44_g5309 [Erysiphe necator]|uniref:Stc1 domain-containing protein n=1 Tax=Uncinula necator TaxID=52586 RepID=A0A0B1P7Q1_UNCNE|nr:hypothetical protein EV44_g5309 [Erysiphe necator]
MLISMVPQLTSRNSQILSSVKEAKNFHSDNFSDPIRNKTFKRCNDCRRRDFDRRHPGSLRNQLNLRPQHSIALPLNAQSDTTMNAVTEIATVLCGKCKKTARWNYLPTASNSSYAKCLNCRTRDYFRRFPPVFDPTPFQCPADFIEDVDDANDEEVNQLAANIAMFEMVEDEVFNGPVPEEVSLGDDPIFMLSQLQSKEFRNHNEIQRVESDEHLVPHTVEDVDTIIQA